MPGQRPAWELSLLSMKSGRDVIDSHCEGELRIYFYIYICDYSVVPISFITIEDSSSV